MSNNLYQAGGPLLANSPVYITREADEKAALHLRRMDYISLIEPREHGKTSLINHLNGQFSPDRYAFAFQDMMAVQSSAPISEWYTSLGWWLLRQLKFIPSDQQPPLPTNSTSWVRFLAEIAERAEITGQKVVIVLDEIGAIPQDRATDFFSVIRSVYTSRQSLSFWQSITFIIAGAFNPKELIQDPNISNFNVAMRVPLDDFTLPQLKRLVAYLGLSEDLTEAMTDRVHYWTGGQPYLSQQLCVYLAKQRELVTASNLDSLVADAVRHFFNDDTHHLERIKKLSADPGLLAYTRRITSEHRGRFNAAVNDKHFRLAHIIGVIKASPDGRCQIRNRIYEQALADFEAPSHLEPVDYTLLQDATATISVTQLLLEDVEELVRIISSLPQLTDEAGRGLRLLFQNAGLDRLIGDFELRGEPRTVAWMVVNRLKNYRPVPEKPDYEVLGLLLCHILTLQELPIADGISIKDIIRKYTLMPPSRQL